MSETKKKTPPKHVPTRRWGQQQLKEIKRERKEKEGLYRILRYRSYFFFGKCRRTAAVGKRGF